MSRQYIQSKIGIYDSSIDTEIEYYKKMQNSLKVIKYCFRVKKFKILSVVLNLFILDELIYRQSKHILYRVVQKKFMNRSRGKVFEKHNLESSNFLRRSELIERKTPRKTFQNFSEHFSSRSNQLFFGPPCILIIYRKGVFHFLEPGQNLVIRSQ